MPDSEDWDAILARAGGGELQDNDPYRRTAQLDTWPDDAGDIYRSVGEGDEPGRDPTDLDMVIRDEVNKGRSTIHKWNPIATTSFPLKLSITDELLLRKARAKRRRP